MERLILFANGEFSREDFYLNEIREDDFIICADGALNFAWQLGLKVQMVVGDMDSADHSILEKLVEAGRQIIRYPAEKNESDLELAILEAIKMSPEEIIIFGALGKRIDHLFANLMLLDLPLKAGIKTSILEEDYEIILTDKSIEIEGDSKSNLSLFPLDGPVRILKTQGLKYPLNNESLYVGAARGLSNQFTAEKAKIDIKEGKLLLIKSKF